MHACDAGQAVTFEQGLWHCRSISQTSPETHGDAALHVDSEPNSHTSYVPAVTQRCPFGQSRIPASSLHCS
jgi:hypothetical protein